ncbi:AsmA-like C-terminal region-containing protein, partial [Pelagibacteraceae bacterium]|nr:AsmA-like C-terminal region-containing protein [Pelagibacteraceae bacterium]
YDATNLLKQLTSDSKTNPLKNYTKDVEIKLKSLANKSKIPLNNFNLIGQIRKGKFEKLSAKSEFSKNEYLDVSLKEDKNNKKILEIYSDLPSVVLADYKFFEGIKGGKLLYNLVYDNDDSASKMTIENFKVVKAPAFAKLLTLADLGGIADLLSGEGMSFDILEINMKSDKNVSTVEEILALGPSLSVLMDGYIEKKTGLVSLGGTLVPAKTLNKLISKIPVVGNILVGNKVGDGVFGVSFKMKGLPGKMKTTVNPVKTLTPRFITRALEKMREKK